MPSPYSRIMRPQCCLHKSEDSNYDRNYPQDVAAMERAASNTKTWLLSAYSAKRSLACFIRDNDMIFGNWTNGFNLILRYFEGVFPYNLLPYDLPYSKKFSGAMVLFLGLGVFSARLPGATASEGVTVVLQGGKPKPRVFPCFSHSHSG